MNKPLTAAGVSMSTMTEDQLRYMYYVQYLGPIRASRAEELRQWIALEQFKNPEAAKLHLRSRRLEDPSVTYRLIKETTETEVIEP